MTEPAGLAAAPPRIGLELALHPDDAARFWRAAPLPALRAGARLRPARIELVWHDSPDAALAHAGLALVEQRHRARSVWRMESASREDAAWPALLPHPVLAEAAAPALLGRNLPDSLAPVARFDGVARAISVVGPDGLAGVALQVGTLRALERASAACRVVLEGAPRETFALARALAGPLRLSVPGAPFPALHRPGEPLPRPALLDAGATIDDALAHLVATLARALLHWAPLVSEADPEPVHQMRVALRRLRAALKLFRRAAACPELDEVADALRRLGRLLGAARDWDVFLGGLGGTVAAAFATERAIARLLREADARRRTHYAALASGLAGPEFRCLGLRLAELAVARPWRTSEPGPIAADALRDLLRHALRKRLRHVRELGTEIERQPDAALHGLRLQCKRLRYSAEFAAPLFRARASRRFLRRLASVQERLGRLNDGVVAATLMAQLGGGAGRALAAGVVRGFVASRGERARRKAERAWTRFAATPAFWD